MLISGGIAAYALTRPQQQSSEPKSDSIARLEPPYLALDNKTSAQLQEYLEPYKFIDVQKCGDEIYILAGVQAEGDAYTDPQGGKFPMFDVFLIKMTANDLYRSLMTTLRMGHGTLSCSSDRLLVFINYKLQNGVYDMGASIYTRRKTDLADLRVDPQFSDGNMGWYPRFTEKGLEYFNYAGYYLMVNNVQLERQSPEEAEDLFKIYQIGRSEGILPNDHRNAVGRIIAKLNKQPNTNAVVR